MPIGYVVCISISTKGFCLLYVVIMMYIHIGMGFGVARSDYKNDAKASMRGTSDR